MKALLVGAAVAALLPLAALAGDQVDYTPDYTQFMSHEHHVEHDSELVRKAYDATKRYKDIKEALVKDNNDEKKRNPHNPDLWVVGTPCVSGPETGAMGIHVVKPGRTTALKVTFDAPAALIYEPQHDGRMALVGLEYIHDAKSWQNKFGATSVPSLDGHLMNYVGAPNRYGLDPFFEIHVWAFEDNPKGAFADWNTHVTCEKQPFMFTVKP
jgi:hypothetical protein